MCECCNKKDAVNKSAGTKNEVISALACIVVFVVLFLWCLPMRDECQCFKKDSDALLMIERSQLLEEIKTKGGFFGVAVDTLQVLDEIPQDSVTVYSSSLIRMKEQYWIYEVIYHIHFMDCDRYFLCNVLKNKKESDKDEVRLVKWGSQLMDLVLQSETHQQQE